MMGRASQWGPPVAEGSGKMIVRWTGSRALPGLGQHGMSKGDGKGSSTIIKGSRVISPVTRGRGLCQQAVDACRQNPCLSTLSLAGSDHALALDRVGLTAEGLPQLCRGRPRRRVFVPAGLHEVPHLLRQLLRDPVGLGGFGKGGEGRGVQIKVREVGMMMSDAGRGAELGPSASALPSYSPPPPTTTKSPLLPVPHLTGRILFRTGSSPVAISHSSTPKE